MVSLTSDEPLVFAFFSLSDLKKKVRNISIYCDAVWVKLHVVCTCHSQNTKAAVSLCNVNNILMQKDKFTVFKFN